MRGQAAIVNFCSRLYDCLVDDRVLPRARRARQRQRLGVRERRTRQRLAFAVDQIHLHLQLRQIARRINSRIVNLDEVA